jgi:hypothetical protein
MTEKDQMREPDERAELRAASQPAGLSPRDLENADSNRERIFTGLAPVRQDDDVVRVTRARSID